MRILLLLLPLLSLSARAADNAYNPAISLILSGGYSQVRQDLGPITGFALSPQSAHEPGFALGESELMLSASIDPEFHGTATLALDPGGTLGVENAYVETLNLGAGLKLKFGRFYSGLGYLNEVHAHAWDFADQPLVYVTLWARQLGEDGVQLKWLAPTDTFLEFGAEIGRGRGFPGSDTPRNGNGATTLFVHAGDDLGDEHSWRAGLSLHRSRVIDRLSENVPDANGTPVGMAFSGDSQTAGLDFVWKYTPEGSERQFKLQAEFFQRKESGELTHDPSGTPVSGDYALTQRGSYVQGVYRFLPRWRLGLRHDRLDPGVAGLGSSLTPHVIAAYGYTPTRTSLMLDYSPSEFSRLRLQLARDASRQDAPDDQLLLQYTMSLGAHGAHRY